MASVALAPPPRGAHRRLAAETARIADGWPSSSARCSAPATTARPTSSGSSGRRPRARKPPAREGRGASIGSPRRCGSRRVEVDLLLLAGLAEEHEGYASAFRAAPPARASRARRRGSRRGCSAARRRARRCCGRCSSAAPPSRSGRGRRRRVTRPFFERTLLPGDALWHGAAAASTSGRAASRPPRRRPSRRARGVARRSRRRQRAAAALARRRAVHRARPRRPARTSRSHRGGALARHAGVAAVAARPARRPRPRRDAARRRPRARARRGPGPRASRRSRRPARPACRTSPTIPARSSLVRRTGSGRPARPAARARGARRPAVDRARAGGCGAQLLPELADDAPLLAARRARRAAVAAEAAAADVRALRVAGRPAADVGRRRRRAVRARAGALARRRRQARAARRRAGTSSCCAPDRLAQLREAVDRLRHQSRVLDDWGFLDGPAGRARRAHAVRRPARHRQDAVGRGAGARARRRPAASSTSRAWSRSGSARPRRTSPRCSTPPSAPRRCCSSTRPTRSSAGAPRCSDAHDRYANLETAYLLARLERFEGLAVLSTNLRQNIDPAFLRRLEFVIDFEEPTSEPSARRSGAAICPSGRRSPATSTSPSSPRSTRSSAG